MKKLHLIVLSLLAVSLINHCPSSSSGNPPNGTQPPTVDNMMPPPTVDNMMPPPTVDNMKPAPTDVNTVKTIHVHVRDDVSNNAEVVDLTDSITVTDPTYSILEGNTANIFSVDSSTGVITIADASKVTYDNAPGANNNNVHLLKVRVRNGTDTTKATEAPLRIVVRGFGGAFITTWTIPEGASTDLERTITIPIFDSSDYDFTVNWGDSPTETTHTGTGAEIKASTTSPSSHTYATAGTYTVIITRDFPRIYFDNSGDRTKILTVEQWGSIAWTSMNGAFNGAIDLEVPAVDAPNLTGVSSMASMFKGANIFNQDINHWDTSSIKNMSSMFNGAATFNQDIGDWNTAMVTDMSNMFDLAAGFNQDIGDWNTAKVTDMSNMFSEASFFNQDIRNWNTAMVENMSFMFRGAANFNQDISTNGNSWNTARVINMSNMFDSAPVFNQDISNWDVSAVTNCANFAGSLLAVPNQPNFMNPPDCSP